MIKGISRATFCCRKSRKVFPMTSRDHVFEKVVRDTKLLLRPIRYGPLTDVDIESLSTSQRRVTNLDMDAFSELIKHYTPYEPLSAELLKVRNFRRRPNNNNRNFQIKPINYNHNNVQCLQDQQGHWICCYFDSKSRKLHIYDSLNFLSPTHIDILEAIYIGHVDHIIHHFVDGNQNIAESGIYAMAYATSICFGRSPSTELYNHSKMRKRVASNLILGKFKPFS